MRIEVGAPAPTFQTEDIFGRPIELSAYCGKTLLLSFFRNAACALCNLRVHHLIERYPEYHRAGLEILAVFEAPRANMLRSVGKQDASFPLVADAEAQLYELYGVENSQEKIAATTAMPATAHAIAEAAAAGFELTHEEGSNFIRLPADLLIGPDGKVLQAHYAEYAWDHLPFEAIEQSIGLVAAI
jgi:peroxiredoxin